MTRRGRPTCVRVCVCMHADCDRLKSPHMSSCSLGFDSLHIPSRSRCSICILWCASVHSYVLYIPSRCLSVLVCWRNAKSGTGCLGFLSRWPFQHTRLSARTPASPEAHTYTHRTTIAGLMHANCCQTSCIMYHFWDSRCTWRWKCVEEHGVNRVPVILEMTS